MTTSNGTTSMQRAAGCLAAGAAALVNVGAAARWAVGRGHDVTVLCAGDAGALSLEDAVCAGLLVDRMLKMSPGLELSPAACLSRGLGEYYGERIDALRLHSRWARRLRGQARSDDLDACLRLDTTAMVPVLRAGAFVSESEPIGVAPASGERQDVP